jgi:hypothetical protein
LVTRCIGDLRLAPFEDRFIEREPDDFFAGDFFRAVGRFADALRADDFRAELLRAVFAPPLRAFGRVPRDLPRELFLAAMNGSCL